MLEVNSSLLALLMSLRYWPSSDSADLTRRLRQRVHHRSMRVPQRDQLRLLLHCSYAPLAIFRALKRSMQGKADAEERILKELLELGLPNVSLNDLLAALSHVTGYVYLTARFFSQFP